MTGKPPFISSAFNCTFVFLFLKILVYEVQRVRVKGEMIINSYIRYRKKVVSVLSVH